MSRTTALLAALLVAGTAGAQKITLDYWSSFNPSEPQAKVIQQTVKDYQAANPKVTIRVNFAGRDLRKLVLPALNSGKSIDLIDGGAAFLAGGGVGRNLLPLDRYLSKPSLGDSGKSVKQVIIPGLLQLTRLEGRLVGIPYSPSVLLFFYNKDAFKKAKITAEPTTWNEFVAVAKALKAAGYEPMTVDQDAYTDINFSYAALRAAGNCAALTKTMRDPTGRLWTSPQFLSMAKDIRGLYDAGLFARDMASNRFPGGQQRVGLGEVAMNLNGSWLPGELRATTGPDFNWGSFSYPSLSGGRGSIKDVMVSPQMYAVVKKSKYPDQAFDFIRYMLSKKSQEALVREAGIGSVRPDVAWPAALNDARSVVLNSSNPVPSACSLRATAGEVLENVALPAFRDLMNGKLTPEAYVKRMSTESAKFWSSRK